MSRNLTLTLFVALLLVSCQREQAGRIARALGPKMQQFSITIGVDTLVRCKGGTTLRFCPNSFVSSEKKITLHVQEVRDRGEAFLLGLSTTASDGHLLETEGMVFLDAQTSGGIPVTINPDCPVRAELPSRGRRAGTKWFGGKVENQGVVWTEIPQGFDNQGKMDALATGDQLFRQRCASCHCPSLDVPLTGPALGNVTKYRTAEWLREFTRRSQKFIFSGDTLAVCVWDKWKPVMMNDQPDLSDQQIDAIYTFIEEESTRLNVEVPALNYDCSASTRAGVQHAADNSRSGMQTDTFYPGNPYFARIWNLGWHNCDLYVNDSTARPATVKVSIVAPDRYDELIAGVLFNSFNSSVQLDGYGNGLYETTRGWNVLLPPAEANIVVIGIKGKKWFLFTQNFTVGATNEFVAALKPVSEKEINAFTHSQAFKLPELTATKEICQYSHQ